MGGQIWLSGKTTDMTVDTFCERDSSCPSRKKTIIWDWKLKNPMQHVQHEWSKIETKKQHILVQAMLPSVKTPRNLPHMSWLQRPPPLACKCNAKHSQREEIDIQNGASEKLHEWATKRQNTAGYELHEIRPWLFNRDPYIYILHIKYNCILCSSPIYPTNNLRACFSLLTWENLCLECIQQAKANEG